jgi:phospholipase/carboxylesterase
MRATLHETEDCVTLEPPVPATGLVVWLHGLGADGYDFVPFARELGLAERGLRVVLPHAPPRPVTINRGYVMRAWYDVRDPDFGRDPDDAGIRQSVERVSALVDAETARGIAADRVVVAGFSQGGVIALDAGLRYPQRLAGLIGLSTYLARAERLEQEASPTNRGVPVLLGHGDQDPIIPAPLGEAAARTLAAAGYAVDFRRYRMAHSVCPAEAADVDAWLRRNLG